MKKWGELSELGGAESDGESGESGDGREGTRRVNIGSV